MLFRSDPEDDTARVLADIVPVPGLREMVSFGDLILTVGLLDAVYHASRPGRSGRRRRGPHGDDSGDADRADGSDEGGSGRLDAAVGRDTDPVDAGIDDPIERLEHA